MSESSNATDVDEKFSEFDDPLVREFLGRTLQENSESALDNHKTVMRQYLPHLDGTSVDEATYGDVVDYADKVVERGHPRETLKVYNSSISSLHDFLNLYYDARMPDVSRIPRQYTDIKSSHEREDIDRDEVKALIDATESLRDALIIALLYFSGMRSSELCNLELSDLDMDSNRFYVVDAKYNGDRWLPIHENVQFLLERWLEEARDAYPMASSSSFVFVGDESDKVDRQDVWEIVHEAAHEAGIQRKVGEKANGHNLYRVKPHVLRHAIATHAFEDGMTLEELAAFLGHEDIDSVRVYVHTHAEEKAIKSFHDNVGSL